MSHMWQAPRLTCLSVGSRAQIYSILLTNERSKTGVLEEYEFFKKCTLHSSVWSESASTWSGNQNVRNVLFGLSRVGKYIFSGFLNLFCFVLQLSEKMDILATNTTIWQKVKVLNFKRILVTPKRAKHTRAYSRCIQNWGTEFLFSTRRNSVIFILH